MIIHSTTLDTMEKVIAIYGGTTWVKIEGRFLLGQSSSYSINSTGGESTHKLTVNEMPSHRHDLDGHVLEFVGRGGTWGPEFTATGNASNTNANGLNVTGYRGGNVAHNNMPPYKVVYIWERTA